MEWKPLEQLKDKVGSFYLKDCMGNTARFERSEAGEEAVLTLPHGWRPPALLMCEIKPETGEE